MPSLSSIAAQSLQRRIVGGEFRQGDTLPPQRELSESLGISRASLREAISMLEALGLVRSQPGKGVFVTVGATPDPASLPESHTTGGSMSPVALIEFRLALEPTWTALAAQRVDQAALASLQEIQSSMQQSLQSGDLVMASEWDLQFHLRIAELSGNPGLVAIAAQYRGQIAHSLRLPFSNSRQVWAPADEHQLILQALAAADPQAAARAMQAHLLSAAHRVGLELPARLPSFAPSL